MKALQKRLRTLERKNSQNQHGPFVFRSIEEARAAGATGCVLIVGALMDEAEWTAAAREQQVALLREVASDEKH